MHISLVEFKGISMLVGELGICMQGLWKDISRGHAGHWCQFKCHTLRLLPYPQEIIRHMPVRAMHHCLY